MLDAVTALMRAGGSIAIVLIILSVVLWTCVGLRALALQRGLGVADYRVLIDTLVTTAPLLGLLGTVSGMVEMFASMEGAAVTRATEQTVAGGISLALVTTQLGLVIGVPGMVAARVLARVEARNRSAHRLSSTARAGVKRR